MVAQYAESVREAKGWSADLSIEEILELRHLGKRSAGKFTPNNACVLLFALDPNSVIPGCKIRFLRFDREHEGTGEKFNAVKDIFIEGQLPKIIAECEKILDSQIRSFSKLGKDGKFYPESEYPESAWHEEVVNSLAHRTYVLKNMCTFVKMFDDRLG